MPTLSKKVINGWAMYDWANSAYALVITSTIFPAYYDDIANRISHGQKIRFLGREFVSSSLFIFATSLAFLIIAFLSPILSSIADYKRNKKTFMKFFCYLGGLSCCSMYFFTTNTFTLGVIAFILAAIGYCGSIVFYNAYLPEIADEKDQDRVSAKGFALGYIGSVILLIFCLMMVLFPQWFGISDASLPPRISFFLVGLWWMGFAQITFSVLPASPYKQHHNKKNFLTNGFHELKKVWTQLKTLGVLKRYLTAFFFYSMGVQTVLYVAAIFGKVELKISSSQLIITILIIQLVAIFGAELLARLSRRIGNIRVLIYAVIFWIAICGTTYFIHTAFEFYMIASCVGFVMGGIQSMSRSTYSKFLPPTEDTASFFSFYDICEKIGIVIGTGVFGLINQITGNMRNSIIFLILFFALGLIFLVLTNKKIKDLRLGNTLSEAFSSSLMEAHSPQVDS
ncbi:MAG: MFS transporter [Chitinophagaceae bacterium]